MPWPDQRSHPLHCSRIQNVKEQNVMSKGQNLLYAPATIHLLFPSTPNHHFALGPGGPSFSMHERVNDPRNKNPGPGAYDPYAHNCLPNFSLGQRLEGITGDKKPGPGAYDTDNPHTGDAPAFTMGFRIERKRPPNQNMKPLKA